MPLDLSDVPSYLRDEVERRVAAVGSGSAVVVDEETGEQTWYTGITDSLKDTYDDYIDERGVEAVAVYQITGDRKENFRLVRYETKHGKDPEIISWLWSE